MSGKQGKIGELAPNTKGEKPLIFEVLKVVEKAANGEYAICRIVDETGTITAYFDQFVQYIVEGSVYSLTNFKCKVSGHHLRLEMTKSSVMAKLPQSLGFKDLQNDLSAKFYVANKEGEAEKNDKKQETKDVNNSKKQQQVKKQHRAEDKNKKNEKNEKKIDYKEKKEVKEQAKKEEPEAPKKYVEKKAEPEKPKKPQQKVEVQVQKKETKKAKYVAKNKQIKLNEMPKHQQESVTFCVRVSLANSKKKEKYFLCKVSDSTGSTFFQFQPKLGSHLQDKAWYKLIDFKIFGDKEYGFIATQEAHSSYELIDNPDETVDGKFIWK